MSGLTHFSDAIISIYDAANDSNGWNVALDVCVDYVNAHSANVMFQENERNSKWRYTLGSKRWRECTPEIMSHAISMFEKYDSQAWAFVHQHKKQTLLADTDFWKDLNSLSCREDYIFFREQLGFERKVGCSLNDNRSWTDNIAFQFPHQHKSISNESWERMRLLLPHAAKSIEMWRTFSILKTQYKAVLSALDHVKIGLCIAEPGGSVIVSNHEANVLLDSASGLRLGNDKLFHYRDPVVTQSILQAIKRACDTSAGKASVPENYQVIGSNKDSMISIEVSPLRDYVGELEAHFNGALITLVDLSSDLHVDTSKISLAYKLSSAEAEVCQLLVKGLTIADIADVRQVSIETVKSQLKSVYLKTQCSGRIDLIRLALKASPPVA